MLAPGNDLALSHISLAPQSGFTLPQGYLGLGDLEFPILTQFLRPGDGNCFSLLLIWDDLPSFLHALDSASSPEATPPKLPQNNYPGTTGKIKKECMP